MMHQLDFDSTFVKTAEFYRPSGTTGVMHAKDVDFIPS